jgi:hypothetical protein
MGLHISTGVGPLRYSKSLTSGSSGGNRGSDPFGSVIAVVLVTAAVLAPVVHAHPTWAVVVGVAALIGLPPVIWGCVLIDRATRNPRCYCRGWRCSELNGNGPRQTRG